MVVKAWSSSSMRRTCPEEPSRSFQPVSSQSLLPQVSPQVRVSGSNNGAYNERRHQQAAERQPKTTFKSRFRFLFVPILRPFCLPRTTHTPGGFKRSTIFAINTTTASGQPVRFFLSARTTMAATRPARFSQSHILSFCARSSPPSLKSDSIE